MGNAKGLCTIDHALRQIQAGQLRGFNLTYVEIADALAPQWGPISVEQVRMDIEGFHRARSIDVYDKASIAQVLDAQDAIVALAFHFANKPELGPDETRAALINALSKANRDRAQMRGIISNGGSPRAAARDEQSFGAFLSELRSRARKLGLSDPRAMTDGFPLSSGEPIDAVEVEVEFPEIDEDGAIIDRDAQASHHASVPPHLATDPDAESVGHAGPDPASIEDPIAALLEIARRQRADMPPDKQKTLNRTRPLPSITNPATIARIQKTAATKPWTAEGVLPQPTRSRPIVLPVDDETALAQIRAKKALKMRRYRAKKRQRLLAIKQREAASLPPKARSRIHIATPGNQHSLAPGQVESIRTTHNQATRQPAPPNETPSP